MAIMEIGLPSGFTADNTDDLRSDLIKRVDIDSDKLVLYLDQVNVVA